MSAATQTTPALYAWVQNGLVREIWTVRAGLALAETVTPAVAAQMVAIPPGTTVTPGDSYSATAGFGAPPAPPAPTLAQQAGALLAGGATLTVTGSLTLTATFPADLATQHKLLGMQALIVHGGGAFPGGAATWPMRDATGAWHQLTPAQYSEISAAIGAFAAACQLVIDGASTTLPSAAAAVTTT